MRLSNPKAAKKKDGLNKQNTNRSQDKKIRQLARDDLIFKRKKLQLGLKNYNQSMVQRRKRMTLLNPPPDLAEKSNEYVK